MFKRVVLLASGFQPRNLRLQPWHYLHRVALQLARRDYQVSVVTAGRRSPSVSLFPERVSGIPVYRLSTIGNPHWCSNFSLEQLLRTLEPDLIIWHIGLSSIVYQRLDLAHLAPVVGIFTTPLYTFAELARVGVRKLASGYNLSLLHLFNALFPGRLLRSWAHINFRRLVVQSATTGRQLQLRRLWPYAPTVICPGVDAVWFDHREDTRAQLRRELGYAEKDTVLVYFGSPAPLRGLYTLVRAFRLALAHDRDLKLLILSRSCCQQQDGELRQWLVDEAVAGQTKVITAWLEPEQLVGYVQAGDIVALPFELVPSDAPLSVLEARAAGKPLITTPVGCLPEMVAGSRHYLAEPGNPPLLAQAILSAASDNASLPGAHPPAPHDLAQGMPVTRWNRVGDEWSSLVETV
jgi:glycosyltransferase involved in cell wall biosynthesis